MIESSILPIPLILSTNTINNHDSDGYTLLHAAVKKNYPATVTHLLSAGADPSPPCKQQPGTRNANATPLVFASESGNIKIIDLLVEHGANSNESTEAGKSCLHNAVSNDHEKAVDVLLEHGANPNVMNNRVGSPLGIAAERGSVDVVRNLIEYGANVNGMSSPLTGLTPLYYAAINGNVDCVRALLGAGAIATHEPVPGGEGWFVRPPSLQTVAGGSLAATAGAWIEMYAWKGAGVREMQGRVGTAGEKEAHAEILRLLIDAGGDVSAVQMGTGISALHMAAAVGNLAMVEILLAEGVNVNVRTTRGLSAVCLARMLEYAHIVELLEKARETKPDMKRPAIGRKSVSR